MSPFVRQVRAHEDETVEIRWTCRDRSVCTQRVTIPPAATREARQPAEPAPAPPLLTYMTTTDPVARDAAFLRTYAERIRNGTAATWEIPSTVAGTLDAIATRINQRAEADGPAIDTATGGRP